jgi:hypothetical protein
MVKTLQILLTLAAELEEAELSYIVASDRG